MEERKNVPIMMKLTGVEDGKDIHFNIRHTVSYKDHEEGTEVTSAGEVTLVKESTEEILNRIIKYFRYKD